MSALVMMMPLCNAVLTPAALVSGIASPKVQGHDTINVAMPASSAVPREAPSRNISPVTTRARMSTTGTKKWATRSAMPRAPARTLWAFHRARAKLSNWLSTG